MNKKIIYIIILFSLVAIVIILYKLLTKEQFDSQGKQRINGIFSIVSVDDYDDFYGPSCIETCIRENGANVKYDNNEGSHPFIWNENNPTKGYCFNANSSEYPYKYKPDSNIKCGNDKNPTSTTDYDPAIDYSQCIIDRTNNMCVEGKLNVFTGSACINTTKCRECIDTYKKNIDTLQAKVSSILNKKRCDT